MTTEETLRNQAAGPVLLRLQADIEGASSRLKPLLETVKASLFEKSFTVAAIWRENGIRDKNAPSIFRELDTTPRAYILRARMETAERLLLLTNLRIRRIAELVGYASHVTFRRAFQSFKGCKPTDVRRRAGFECRDEPGLDQDVAKGLSGRLSPTQMVELAKRLKTFTLELQALENGVPHHLEPLLRDSAKMEPYLVGFLVMPWLAGLSFEDQRQVILASRPFSTSALFDALHQKSRAEGRKDRRRGVELSRLALDSVEANARSLGALYHVLRPQAWAWLGNAHRLDLDFLAADRAIHQALVALRSTDDPFAAGIAHLCQGTLRTFQRRHEEAVQLFDVALPAFEEAGDEGWQIVTLSHRAAALSYAERHETALATLAKAAALPGADSEPFASEVPRDIAATLIRLGRFSDAEKQLVALSAERRGAALHWRHRWLEASVDHGSGRLDRAEEKFLAGAKMLEERHEPLYRALLLLDLAVLYADQQRASDVISTCRSIYPVFKSLRLYEETLASVRLLGEALSEASVPSEVLQSLQASMRQDPLAQQS